MRGLFCLQPPHLIPDEDWTDTASTERRREREKREEGERGPTVELSCGRRGNTRALVEKTGADGRTARTDVAAISSLSLSLSLYLSLSLSLALSLLLSGEPTREDKVDFLLPSPVNFISARG